MSKTPVELSFFNPNVPVAQSRFRLLAFDATNKVFIALDSLEQLFGVAGGGGDGLPPGANNTVLIRDAANAPVFVPQQTGFNLPLGTTAGTVAAGDHTHELDELLATGITAGDVLTADGAGGASFAPFAVSSRKTLFFLAYNTLITLTNMPAAAQSMPLNDPNSRRGHKIVDMTGYTEGRFIVSVATVGSAGSTMFPTYYIFTGSGQGNGSGIGPGGFIPFGPDFEVPIDVGGGPNWQATDWAPLPVGLLNQSVVIWVGHQGGNGIADPQLLNIQLQLR